MMLLTTIKDAIQGKAKLSQRRSSKWSAVRRAHLKANPTCAVCGGTEKVEVHHIKAFHEHRELELDPTNLISLCESGKFGANHHLLFGHLGNYQITNPDVIADSITWKRKLAHDI